MRKALTLPKAPKKAEPHKVSGHCRELILKMWLMRKANDSIRSGAHGNNGCACANTRKQASVDRVNHQSANE